ncbi:MAG: glutamate--tRNA ligase [Gammaproteobacteria bacterium]|nr:glutamate--tRNA ligase [Gammaproteobacteria bacterium]
MTVVTRFAPSPTGYLHVGGARTALFCWLYAKKMQGKFILRIEDTDLERSTSESVQAILDAMQWLDLAYDEGPYYQTKRFDRYRAVMAELLTSGKAYRCDCSKERLEKLRETQMANKQKPRYDGHCRARNNVDEKNSVIRFKNPEEGAVEFDDLVRGHLVFQNSELDDLIIARSDGSPTYNFTVVVDDWDMHITHVIRGDDHINNTPRQINILRALGAELPVYAHVPMILGSDGKRLSKRHGAVSVMQYREEGYLPEALLNYLVRLGWSYGDQEIFSREEMIRYFDMTNINRAPAAFNPEKLIWLNQHYIRHGDQTHVQAELAWHMKKLGIDISAGPTLTDLLAVQADRVKTLLELAEKSRYFYSDNVTYNDDAVKKNISPETLPALAGFADALEKMSDWQREAIHQAIVETAESRGLKMGKLAQPLRVVVTGDTVSPPIDSTLFLLGRERVLARLKKFQKNFAG